MHYDQLRAFVETAMRMSHIDQPVVFTTLPERGGGRPVTGVGACRRLRSPA